MPVEVSVNKTLSECKGPCIPGQEIDSPHQLVGHVCQPLGYPPKGYRPGGLVAVKGANGDECRALWPAYEGTDQMVALVYVGQAGR
jgi:hypothetical protein